MRAALSLRSTQSGSKLPLCSVELQNTPELSRHPLAPDALVPCRCSPQSGSKIDNSPPGHKLGALDANESHETPTKPRRQWLKGFAFVLLGLLGAAMIFHRPILFEIARQLVARAADQQHLRVEYEINGSIFSNLTIRDLRATPTEPGPIQRLEVGSLHLEYSLWDAWKLGLSALLKVVDVEDVFLEMTPADSLTPEKDASRQKISFPLLIPSALNLENINVAVHRGGATTQVEGLDFRLVPDHPGVLHIRILDIPNIRKWEELSATTSYHDRHLILNNLAVGPEIELRELSVDFSKWNEERLSLALDGHFFRAPVSVSASVSELHSRKILNLHASTSDLTLDHVAEFLHMEIPVAGTIANVDLTFSGAPEDPKSWELHAAGTSADLSYGSEYAAGKVTFDAQADGLQSGALTLRAENLKAAGISMESVATVLDIKDGTASVEQAEIVIKSDNRITLSGHIGLGDQWPYEAKANLALPDVAVLQPLWKSHPVAGALTTHWQGRGDRNTHSGSFGLQLEGGKFDRWENITARMRGSYGEGFVDVPEFFASSPEVATAEASLFWSTNQLKVGNLTISQDGSPLVAGSLDLPLILNEDGALIPSDTPVSASLKTPQMDIAETARRLKLDAPPVTGKVQLDLTLGGTRDAPTGDITLHGASLRTQPDMPPATLEATARLTDNAVNLHAQLSQQWIRPITITGSVGQILNGAPGAMPLDLLVKWPESSLDFIAGFLPDVRRLQGTASADVRVTGTAGQPVAKGELLVRMPMVRFVDEDLPPVDNIVMRVGLANDRATFQEVTGRVGGGTFRAGGNMSWAQGIPLDLNLNVREALLMQDDTLSLRASADLSVRGPMDSAHASGTVGITRSRFFKNIEILPIALPGRPAPELPPMPRVTSFPPPLRDWTFDIAIRTADPFLVRSNLARGRILADMRMLGTGQEPWLEGALTIENLTASLPFSRLEVRSGSVFFTRQEPFVPQLNIRGTSTIRAYDVTVQITGTADQPDAFFTSNPPLPQSQIVALIATGMTTDEITNDPNALAGRAAILAVQELYRRIFKKGKPPSEESFFSRIQIDLGATDPRTGRQGSTVRLPLSERFVLTGGMDVAGNFQGQIRYLMRFR